MGKIPSVSECFYYMAVGAMIGVVYLGGREAINCCKRYAREKVRGIFLEEVQPIRTDVSNLVNRVNYYHGTNENYQTSGITNNVEPGGNN